MALLLLKGGPGSGNHRHRGRPGKVGGSAPSVATPLPDDFTPPSSAHCVTPEAAQAYWREHLASRTFELSVRLNKKVHRLRVDMGHGSHAYTQGAHHAPHLPVIARDGGARVFDVDRSRRMDLILPTIMRPWRVVDGGDGHIYLHHKVGAEGRLVVVLKPVSGHRGSLWAFTSAHLRQSGQLARTERAVATTPGLLKAETRSLAGPGLQPDDGMTGPSSPHLSVPVEPPPEGDQAGIRTASYVSLFLPLFKALGANERWITVRPNGPGTDGHPILIQMQKDGSAKVIGGAGGSLNHLRLTGVKPQSSYRETVAARARERRERAKAQRERDKAAGVLQAKTEAHRKVTEQQAEARRAFVKDVAAAMGWDESALAFDETAAAALPEHVAAGMRRAHEADLVRRAIAAVKLNRERLSADPDAAAGVSAPLVGDGDEPTVDDIDPVRQSTGLGFAPEYAARAADAGAEPDAIRREAATLKREPTPEQRRAAIRAGETARLVKDGLETLREPDRVEKLKPRLVEAEKVLDLLKLDKRRRLAEQQARAARREINESAVEPQAAVVEVDDAAVNEAVAREIADDVRTVATRAFLDAVNESAPDPVRTMARHVGAGAYNSVNALALAAGGAALVDRSVVDVLGVAGAADVLARRLQADLAPEDLKALADGMEAWHVKHYMETSKEALERARALKAQAAALEVSGGGDGHDLAALREVNRRRRDALAESHKVLGQALGETEANAALVYALKRGGADKPYEVSLGDTAVEDAITKLRAIGLQRGDYQIETVGGSRLLKVTPEGMLRLAEPVRHEDLKQVRRNLDIIGGALDRDGWMPDGVVDRADLGLDVKPGSAPTLAKPFDPDGAPDLESAVRDYIGGRAADGDAAADILADLQSADFMAKVGPERSRLYASVLDRLAPLKGDDGKLKQAESLRPAFEAMADDYVARLGGKRSPLHRQTVPVDGLAVEALHRALAEEPAGVAAYKPVGELTPQDQGALRTWFAQHVAKETPEAAALREEAERVRGAEPEREAVDMFGEAVTNPEWSEWKNRRDDLQARARAASLSWSDYVVAMHGPERAYAAVQDLVRSTTSRAFADAYNRLNPRAPVKLGRTVIRENLNHLDAVDPKAREARLARERALIDGLRNRVQGRYASGSVRDKLDVAREDQAGEAAAQMSFFAAEPEPETARALDPDERHTLGHAAERQLAALMGRVGANFKAGQPVKLFRPSMSGGKNWPRQRAIRLLEANKRVALSFGTGSGKTLLGLGAFSHLHAAGKVKRGLFLVPSIAQGQFGAEALRFLEPGRFRWHAQPGAAREERIAAYKDPAHHFAVMTHQAFRDDMIHLGAKHAGLSEEAMGQHLAGLGRKERAAWMRETMRREGIAFDYLNVDEGHDLLNRRGKANSALANVVDALSDTAPYYVNASADPIKNDVSEAFSLLQKMDPERYTDEAAFMRRYGVDTLAAKEGLRRELARYQYPSRIDPDVTAHRSERRLKVSDGQKQALSELSRNLARARVARMQGGVDVQAVKAVSPDSFKGVPVEQHEAVARELTRSLGVVQSTAVKRILDAHPTSPKFAEVSRIAAERKGKPGVVFAHSLAAVEALRRRLEADGHRVRTITGKDGAKEKGAAIRAFNPDSGEREADIIVASDAGATGANLQSGRWLVQFDTCDTAKGHAQRAGRVHRIGQNNDVELIDLVSDHPEEHRARERLRTKYALRDLLTSPMEALDDTGLGGFLHKRRVGEAHGALF